MNCLIQNVLCELFSTMSNVIILLFQTVLYAMPIQMKSEPHDLLPVQNPVPYVQQLQQVVGNGLGCRPQIGISIAPSNPSSIPPVGSVPSSNAAPVTKQKSPVAVDLSLDENIEDRVDVESIKGVFGWETLDGVNVPYILRKKKKYVAVRIVERKLLSRYPNSFPDELSKKEPLVSYFVTENEAKLLNEINSIHCSYEYGNQEFTGKDLIVDLSEFEDFYNIVKKTFPESVLAQFRNANLQQISPHSLQSQPIPSQHIQSQPLQSQPLQSQLLQSQPLPSPTIQSAPLPDHDKVELAKVCGWVQINNTVSPYIKRFNGKYVPLSVIKYAAGLLTDVEVEGILPTLAECNLLNDTCKIAGFDFNFGQSTKVIHLSEVTQRCKVNILELPFDDPLSHAQYIDAIPSTPPVLLQQEERPVGIPPQPSPTTSDPRLENIQHQVENVPPSINPNINPFGRYPAPHYSTPAAPPQTGPPPPYPYMNFVNMMRQQFSHQGLTDYSALAQGQRLPAMSLEAMQGSRTVPNMNSPPRQYMSSKTNHQNSHSSQVKHSTNPYNRGSYGPNTSGNSYGPHPSANSYGPKPCRSPFGPTSPGSQFAPGPPQQSPGNQTAMYMNRMMSPQMMPNGHSQAPVPYLSQPGPRGSVNNIPPRQHYPSSQRFKSPNVSVLPNSSINSMKMPQRLSSSQFSTAQPTAVTHLGGVGQSKLSACSPQFPGGNAKVRSPQFESRVTAVVTLSPPVNNSQVSPKQVSPAVTSASLRTSTGGSNGVKPAESTDKMVSKITGVVLNGKSISCMAIDEAERAGQFCLIEAVCKLYFSQSSMNEFLFALQNVLKIPLYACTDSEEKAFIQYYNLPVSVLKCNKMIKLTDLNSYFPQMQYMFIQAPDSEEGGSGKAKASSSSASDVVSADAAGSPASDQQMRKRLSSSPMESSVSKQPCRRLEEMVKKLKEGQGSGDEGKYF